MDALVQSWTVGLGLEAPLNGLRELVGLSRLPSFDAAVARGRVFLDYGRLVRPEVVAETYAHAAKYSHAEDFFFRSVHLGTECWAFVAVQRLEGAREVSFQGGGRGRFSPSSKQATHPPQNDAQHDTHTSHTRAHSWPRGGSGTTGRPARGRRRTS